MKIATLNIDWAKKVNRQNIEVFLQQQDFDFLILTEALNLNLSNYSYQYLSVQIPANQIYEELNYTEYLKGESAYRTIIYSKIPAINKLEVIDNKTSIALEFETTFGNIIIYSTIIGSLFRKEPYAQKELQNCIKDCEKLHQINQNLIIVGDLNTSFQNNEKAFTINPQTTTSLRELFIKLNLINATEKIEKNIDHIILPKSLKNNLIVSKVFIEKDILSDHKGVFVSLK